MAETDSVLTATRRPEAPVLVSTGNGEVDKKIGGGLPAGSLTMVEGQSDAGKSVLAQQFAWGAAISGMRVAIYTTENSTPSLLRQMHSLSFDIADYYITGCVDVYPMPNSFDSDDPVSIFDKLLRHMEQLDDHQVFIIDSLTAFINHASEGETLEFFTRARDVCDARKTIIATMHSYALNEQFLIRLRSICDAHLRLRVEEAGDQLVNVLEVSKVRGAAKSTGNIISFNVEPGIGMRVIPITRAKA